MPFSIEVRKTQVRTSQGAVGTLEEFVALAKEDFREAYQLFVEKSFPQLLKEREELLPYYETMVKMPAPYQNLEEFLIKAGLKEPVSLGLEKEKLELYEVQSSLKDTLRIRRSGWGFLRAEITVSGDFLEVEKQVIHDGDVYKRQLSGCFKRKTRAGNCPSGKFLRLSGNPAFGQQCLYVKK